MSPNTNAEKIFSIIAMLIGGINNVPMLLIRPLILGHYSCFSHVSASVSTTCIPALPAGGLESVIRFRFPEYWACGVDCVVGDIIICK